MQQAVECVKWFDQETERIYLELGVSVDHSNEILEMIAEYPEGITPRILHRKMKRRFRSTGSAEKYLTQMVANGVLKIKTIKTGGRPKTVYC